MYPYIRKGTPCPIVQVLIYIGIRSYHESMPNFNLTLTITFLNYTYDYTFYFAFISFCSLSGLFFLFVVTRGPG